MWKGVPGIGALRRINPFVPLCTLVTLYKSLIPPYFDLRDTYGKQVKDKGKAPPGNQLLLCVASIVKLTCIVLLVGQGVGQDG